MARVAVFVVAMTVVMVACTDNPSIDGTKVTPLGNNPSCADVCARLVHLCGFAPAGANCANADASGYCDTLFSPSQVACIGQTTSCSQAWDTSSAGCLYAPPTTDAGGDDSEAGQTGDGGDDGSSNDASSE